MDAAYYNIVSSNLENPMGEDKKNALRVTFEKN
jgi:hypothetical protein